MPVFQLGEVAAIRRRSSGLNSLRPSVRWRNGNGAARRGGSAGRAAALA